MPLNIIQPFQLETSSYRGRLVQLDSVLNDIITAHEYPAILSQLLGETITLCSLLSSMLKYEGTFILQVQGDGPIKMVMADMTSEGQIRACASYDPERLQACSDQLEIFSKQSCQDSYNKMAQLFGQGHIAFTVDQGDHTDRYQGIVELKGDSLIDCVQHYFCQSEQINTGIKIGVGKHAGEWKSTGIMLQSLPEERFQDENSVGYGNVEEDDWRRSMILLESCTYEELLDPAIDPHNLLIRLFHEEGVRVFEPISVEKYCRCSQDKVESILSSMSNDERDDLVVDGVIAMTCEFCNQNYVFNHKNT